MRPAANAPEQPRHTDLAGPSVDANFDEFRTKGIGDLAVQIRTADHAHLSLVHGAERIHRRPVGLPLPVLFDDVGT